MDQALIDLTTDSGKHTLAPGETTTTRITFINEDSGEVEVETVDGPRNHRLKPLSELYGSGVGAGTVDPTSDQFMALFLSIEEGIVRHYRSDPGLTDATVLLALDRLGMEPECEPRGDELIRHLQLELRLLLSLKDYSRQEVRAAIRKIAKSVARHTRLAGPRGYLSFIREQLSRY